MLFCFYPIHSVISLFVSKSTLGLGTIIGSEVFNHLVISAACVLACSPEKPLKLDAAVFTREVFSYILTLIVFMLCLHTGTFDPANFDECLTVTWIHGLILMVGYIFYALLVVYFDVLINSSSNNSPNKSEFETKKSNQKYDILDHSTNPNSAHIELIQRSSDGDGINSGDHIEELDHDREVVFNPIDHEVSSTTTNPMSPPVTKTNSVVDSAVVETRKGILEYMMHYITLPLRTAISSTIIDVTKKEWRSYYIVTALTSVIWLGILAEVMLEWYI
jgi:Ca2+/Na+ antiporter